MLPRPFVSLVACAALSCSTFHTVDPNTDASPAVDAGTGTDTGARDATDDATKGTPGPDGGAPDATVDAGTDVATSPADAATDAPPPLDTACAAPWTSGMCAGRKSTSVGSLTATDDPRISMALSAGGALGFCYAEDASDFLTRKLYFVTRATPTATLTSSVYDFGMTDTTPACAISGGDALSFRTIASDTVNSAIDYGEFVAGQGPTLNGFGPSSVTGYLTLGVATVDATHVLAVIGSGTTGTILSFAGLRDGFGGAAFASAVTVASGLSFNVPGSEAFALLAVGTTPALLLDVGPTDAAGTRLDFDVWNGTSWTTSTVEGAGLQAAIGWSPSLAQADGGELAAYFERDLDAGPDAFASQLHLTTIVDGAAGAISTPLPAVLDDPQTPGVAVAAAVAPDGRTFVVYATSPDPLHTILSFVRPESPLPGAPLVTDTIDDALSSSDVGSVQMVVEPSGRVDIAYMRQVAKSVYLAVREP